MDISFITSSMTEGGAQRVISVLAKHFSEKGYCVRILLTEKSEPTAYSMNDSVDLVYLEQWAALNFKLSFKDRLFNKLEQMTARDQTTIRQKQYFRRKSKILAKYLKQNPTDVLYSFLVEPNIIVGLGSHKIDDRIIMAERNYPKKPMLTDGFIQLRNRCYSRADVCVFQTVEQKEMFPQEIQDKAVIIPNPVKQNLPQPHQGDRRKIIVNYCGLRDQKNLPLLIHAFSCVSAKHSDYSLEIYGEGSLRDSLNEMIRQLGIENKAHILSFDPNIHKKIRDCAMFVMTSDYEGMPNSLIEAMAIGLPVISTDCLGGGARAVINDGANGLLVPCGDAQAVADAMLDLIEHTDRAEMLSKNAVKIRETLAVDKIAEQWLRLAQQ